MIYFTLNEVEIKYGRVETLPNRSEVGFPSWISRQSREAAAKPIKPLEPRGCRAADVPRGTTRGRRVCSGLGSRRGSSGQARRLSGGSDSGRGFWLWRVAGFWLRWVGLNFTIGLRFVSVGREVLDRGSEIGSDFVFLAWLPANFFGDTLSPRSRRFDVFFPPFSSLLLPLIPFMVVVWFVRT